MHPYPYRKQVLLRQRMKIANIAKVKGKRLYYVKNYFLT